MTIFEREKNMQYAENVGNRAEELNGIFTDISDTYSDISDYKHFIKLNPDCTQNLLANKNAQELFIKAYTILNRSCFCDVCFTVFVYFLHSIM